ncbi:MAG: hypothetical protein IPN19_12745 [Elusimicrobia bacterium]|nr:hypothetical protein [Elusimicrobiota bacterium]
MGAITKTSAGITEFAGDYKVLKLTIVPASASDTVTLTAATHGISEILYVQPKLTAGYDAALAGIFATFSGLVITVVTTAAAGTAATDWTGATGELLVIGR